MALDPYYNNVSLLLPMEGTNNSAAFIDYSPTSKTITRAGDTKILTAQSKWGNGSGYFDGSGDYLDTPDHEGFTMGSGDFTVECWMMPTELGIRAMAVFGQATSDGADNSIAFALYINTDSRIYPLLRINGVNYHPDYGNSGVGVALTANQWVHTTLVRYGSTVYLYENGVLASSISVGTWAMNDSPSKMAVGRLGEYNNLYFKGYLQDLRITKGIARYTTDFTPPPRLWTPEHHSAKYLYPGALPTLKTLSGNCIVSGNGGAQQVVIRDAATRLLIATATPASNGDWSASVPPGDYDISYFAPNCQPICHGPYTVTA